MRIKTFFLFLVSMLILLTACSTKNQEVTPKVTANYSDKIGSEMAVYLIEFVTTAVRYNSIAFDKKEPSSEEKDIMEFLHNQTLLLKDNKTLNSDEKEIRDIMFEYSIDVPINLNMLKTKHQIALNNEKLGITEHQEYLDINEKMKQIQTRADEIIEKFRRYLDF